jgi:hypothetical protein
MEYIEFLQLLKNKPKVPTEKTLRLWHVAYKWILLHGYADTADSPDFVKHMNTFRSCSTSTLSAHLRRMSGLGLLKRNMLKRTLPVEVREELSLGNPFLFLPGLESLPTTLVRYCLPSQKCSLEFKSLAAEYARVESRSNEFRAQMSRKPPQPFIPD